MKDKRGNFDLNPHDRLIQTMAILFCLVTMAGIFFKVVLF